MELDIINSTILKPTLPCTTPCTKIPLTIFDKAAFDLHVAVLYAFRPPMPTNDAIIAGLSKALHYFPHLAGRLTFNEQSRPCIILNGAGIRLVETQVKSTLAERLPLEPSSELTKLHPPIDGIKEVLQIQLNRYSCGGLVIGQTAHHRVCDGQSMSSFFVAWARLVRGMDVDPVPYHDRPAISVPRNPPQSDHNHRAIEFDDTNLIPCSPPSSSSNIVNLVLHYSADFISQLKNLVSEDRPTGLPCTTFQCLLTHIWKKMTVARRLGDDETTQVRVAVNGRARMRPAVPMHYFGNLVLWAYPRLKVTDLLNQSYSFVVEAIHEAVARVDSEYFQSFIDFGEMSAMEELSASAPEIGKLLCPDLEVDSWLSFQFHDLDFGFGGPCAFLPAELPIEGLLLFVPSYKEKGGVDVFIAVSEDHVGHFKLISHT